MYDWNVIREHLQKGVVRFTFKKVSNGDIRVMDATLKEELLPETKGVATRSDDIITVMDLDKNHWRSLRKDSILKVELDTE